MMRSVSLASNYHQESQPRPGLVQKLLSVLVIFAIWLLEVICFVEYKYQPDQPPHKVEHDIKILTSGSSFSFQSVSTSNVSSLICFIPNKYFPISVLEREYHTMRGSQPDHGPQGDPC